MLKKYQKETLEVLSKYLHRCAIYKDVIRAYSESTLENFRQEGAYNNAGFTNIPYVCLRLPTGGGKTFLASHSIPIACKEFLARDFSLVIWLVPSNAILEQTYNCLQDNNHPYRQVLNEYFNGNVEILKVEDARSISKGSLQLNTMQIPQEQVAVATGTERGIENKDLLSETEPIRFIITKQALKEGWDCPFAYIFCSVAKVSSSKDVEQLLGRVLRMPKVQRKNKAELNRAYAFVSSNSFYNTAKNLKDSLIESGFSSVEASELIEVSQNQLTLGSFFGNVKIQLSSSLDDSKLSPEIKNKILINDQEKTIILKEIITESEKEEIKSVAKSESDREIIEQTFQELKSYSHKGRSPFKQGKRFTVPQLLFEFEGVRRPFDEEFLILPDWNLTECDSMLTTAEFPIRIDVGTKGLIDVDFKGDTILHSPQVIQEELTSLIVSSTMDKDDLIQWLVKECRHQSISYSQTIVFITNSLENLISSRNLSIEQLVYVRFRLKDTILTKIKNHFDAGKKQGFQTLLFSHSNKAKDLLSSFSTGQDFEFTDSYFPTTDYTGSFCFSKHFHDRIGELNDEEAECAFNIDINPNVEFWIINLERQVFLSFWLQTSTDKFYPDFIVKLKDGTIVIVEYKGENIFDTPDSKEKRQIGDFYAAASKGKCRFRMLKGKDWAALEAILSP